MMMMKSGAAVCVFTCVFYVCCAVRERPGPGVGVQELTVTGGDLQDCGQRKRLCVTSGSDCLPTASDLDPESFLNASCRFLVQENSFSCRWIQKSGVRPERVNSFIFSREKDITQCRSIFNPLSIFSLTIRSRSAEGQVSAVYPVVLEEISQAPRPVVTSFSVTPSSVWLSWGSGNVSVRSCRIRHRLSGAPAWTETPVSGASQYLISGLQSFSLYDLSVSCSLGYGWWSDWSEGTLVKTSESPPSASVSLSYYVVSDQNSGTQRLVLLWKALDVSEARGLIRGYDVTYTPVRRPLLTKTHHTVQLKLDVPVISEEYEVSVWAYNSAGRSPPRRLRVDPSQTHGVCALKDVWAHSDGSSLRIRWDHELTSTNITETAIEWSDAAHPEHTHWKGVNGSTLNTHLTGVGREQTIRISVYPVCECVSGPPLSISADLQRGALLDVERLAVVSVSRSAVTVSWSWRETDTSVNVLQYRLMLSSAAGSQVVSVFPDQHQHSFLDLQPNRRYTVSVLGETLSRNFTTARLDVNTLAVDPAVLTRLVVPLVLLLLVCGIFSVLSRTTCRAYFFPIVADPRLSPIGHWLLDPRLQTQGKVCVLKLDSVFLWDHVPQKDVLQVEHRTSLLSVEGVVTPALTSVTSEGTALWKHTSDCDTHTRAPSCPPEYIDSPIIPDHADYVQAGQIPGADVF